MDSQLTLVTVAPEIRLMFDRDSMKNATLLLDSVPAYTISTDTTNACTELRVTGTGELLARVAWKDILPDTITFPTVNGGREMGLKKWLNKSKLSDGSCAIVPILVCSFHQTSSADTCQSMSSGLRLGILRSRRTQCIGWRCARFFRPSILSDRRSSYSTKMTSRRPWRTGNALALHLHPHSCYRQGYGPPHARKSSQRSLYGNSRCG
jgi:hypothetical protein